MYQPIHVYFPAVIAAVVASFFLGWLWYGPLFGKKWAGLMGMATDAKPDAKVMMRGMALMVLGTFLTAYVLLHASEIWRPSVWDKGADAPFYFYGFFSAFFTWIGFYVPMLLGAVAWEGRSWGLFRINAAYHFVNLQLIGMILAYWR